MEGGILTDKKKKRRHVSTLRYTGMIAFFCILCTVFLARLINFQIIARDEYAPSASDEWYEIIYIDALRGNICDRNGKVLVSSQSKYTLELDYMTVPDTKAELNRVLLDTLYAIDEAGGESILSENLSPFKGTYPNMEFNEKFFSDPDTYNEFIRLIEKNYVTEDYPLEKALAENDAASVSRYYARKYEIVKEKKGETFSYTSEFSDEEISRLIAVRYEMDRIGFGPDDRYVFATDISYNFYVYVKELALPGIYVGETSVRKYNYPGYASHILGLTGRIYAEDWPEYKDKGYDMDATVGVSGCEAAFEEYLRGVKGIIKVYRDQSGKVTRTETIREAKAGLDVWLTIDIDLQIAAENALEQNIENIRSNASYQFSGEDATSGSVVAMDPSSGELLALASYPSFDLSTYSEDYAKLSKDKDAPLLNRVLQSTCAPGSTFKVGMALALLETGTASAYSTYACNGYYWRYGQTNAFKCAVYPQQHGYINVSKAIEVSCNCYFYEAGHQLGISTMNEWCRRFGLGEHTGIELSEKTGILAGEYFRDTHPDFCRENGLGAWQTGDTWQAAIGQSENAFTPLQVNSYISCIVNGGTRYAAHLLHSVHEFGSDGELVLKKSPEILESLSLSKTNVNIIKNAMRDVISGSDAAYNIKTHFYGVDYSVGGKSGTAQAGSNASNNAWFTGFAPLDDPQITVTCIIEHGASGGNSAYTVREVMDAFFGS